MSRTRKNLQRVYVSFRVYGPVGGVGEWRIWHPKGSSIVLEGWELDEARRLILEAFARSATEGVTDAGSSEHPDGRDRDVE
jgi:hypothetical protein